MGAGAKMPRVRLLVLMVAAAAAALSVADYLAWRTSHHGLGATAAASGLLEAMPDMEARLRRETEPARAATLVAWGLLDLEVDRSWLSELSEAERLEQMRMGIDRLRLARRLALDVLPRRPASWQAAMVLGATRYLEAERTGERSQPSSSWRRPLVAAMRLAPGHPEPPLFLASASLSRWSSLSPAEREETLPVLTRAMQGPAGLELLLRPWARLAPSMETMLEVVPNQPEAWRQLGKVFQRAGDLERLCAAHERWLDSLPGSAAEKVRQSRLQRHSRDTRSVNLARAAIALPADVALAGSFSEALTLLPEAVRDSRTRQDLRRWLLWALDLCVLGECPLAPEPLSSLAGLVEGLHPAQAALAALAAGDPAAANELETGANDDPPWRRYWIYKALRLAADDPEGARRALERAGAGGRDLLYWRAAERAHEAGGDAAALAAARREIDRVAGSAIAADWSFRDGSWRLILASSAPSEAWRLRFDHMPPTGGAVEIRWNGQALGAVALAPGEDLFWKLPVAPGLHQLEITGLAGTAVRPGSLDLEAPPHSRLRPTAAAEPTIASSASELAGMTSPKSISSCTAAATRAPSAANTAAFSSARCPGRIARQIGRSSATKARAPIAKPAQPPVTMSSSGSLWARFHKLRASSAGATSGKASWKVPRPVPVSGKRCHSSTHGPMTSSRLLRLSSNSEIVS